MRIQEERGDSARIKTGSGRNARKRRRLAGHLALIGGDHMASFAPAARKLFAIAGIGRKYRLRNHGHGEAATEQLQLKVGGFHRSRSLFAREVLFEPVPSHTRFALDQGRRPAAALLTITFNVEAYR